MRRGEESEDEREEGGDSVPADSPVISPSLTWGGCYYSGFATDPASCALYPMLFYQRCVFVQAAVDICLLLTVVFPTVASAGAEAQHMCKHLKCFDGLTISQKSTSKWIKCVHGSNITLRCQNARLTTVVRERYFQGQSARH